jgi:hypothetical protein
MNQKRKYIIGERNKKRGPLLIGEASSNHSSKQGRVDFDNHGAMAQSNKEDSLVPKPRPSPHVRAQVRAQIEDLQRHLKPP